VPSTHIHIRFNPVSRALKALLCGNLTLLQLACPLSEVFLAGFVLSSFFGSGSLDFVHQGQVQFINPISNKDSSTERLHTRSTIMHAQV
jgi:hypothetical protein